MVDFGVSGVFLYVFVHSVQQNWVYDFK